MEDNRPTMSSRRDFIAVVASGVGVSGCLQFSESDRTTTSRPRATETGADESAETPTQSPDSPTPRETEPTETQTTQETEPMPNGTRWAFSADAPFAAGPVYADGTVIATSVDRNVYGVDPETGDQRWAVSVETRLDSELAVTNGVAVAAGGGEQVGVTVADGTKTYQRTRYGDGIRAQVSGASVVFQAGFPDGVRAIRPSAGETVWSDTRDRTTNASIDHDGETVCVAYNPDANFGDPPWGFAGFDADSGEQLWYHERDIDLSQVSPRVAVSDGVCIGFGGNRHSTGRDHHMSIDARSGEILTEQEHSNVGQIYGTTDSVVVLSKGDRLQGLDIESGATRWQADQEPAGGRVSVDGTTLWFLIDGATAREKRLYSAEMGSGRVRQRGTVTVGESPMNGDLAVVDGTVFVTMEDATLRAINPA